MATEATTHEEELPRWISDRPEADSDALNFDPYVRVLHRFLMHAEPPLTLSVEGEWGAGKSSFMQQLQARLDRAGQVTVDFNPWRHHAEEAL